MRVEGNPTDIWSELGLLYPEPSRKTHAGLIAPNGSYGGREFYREKIKPAFAASVARRAALGTEI